MALRRFIRRRVRRRLRRYAVTCGVVIAAVVSPAVLIGVVLAHQAPAWWRSVQPTDPTTIAMADRVENFIITQATEQRQVSADGSPRPWALALGPEEANAWLNAKLPQWLANQSDHFAWPENLGEVQVDFRGGRLAVGVRVVQGGSAQILSATLDPQVHPDGSLWVAAGWISVGRLAIPASWVLSGAVDYAKQKVPQELRALPEARAMFAAFAGQQAIMKNASHRLHDGRRIRLLGLEARGGKLLVTCQTDAR